MPDARASDPPVPANTSLANGPQRMAIMKNETVTRFRREDRNTCELPAAELPAAGCPAAPGSALDGDARPDLGRQHVVALHRLYDPILNEPVPDRMLDLLRSYKS